MLEIDGSFGHLAFAITDPLAPGSQYPYRLPEHLFPDGHPSFDMCELDGEVRFSVRTPAGDCNPTNDTFTKTIWPAPCYP